jgi:HEAT repeats
MFSLPPLLRTSEAALRDLRSARAEVRISALRDLAHLVQAEQLTKRQASPGLMACLGDKDAEVRAAAALVSAELRVTEALPVLLALCDDAQLRVRQMALSALGELGGKTEVATVAKHLASELPDVRYQALLAYCQLESDVDARAHALAHAVNDVDDPVAHIALRTAEEQITSEATKREPFHSVHDAAILQLHNSKRGADVQLCAAMFCLEYARGGAAPPEARAAVLQAASSGTVNGKVVSKEEEAWAIELAGRLGARELRADFERRAFGFVRFLRDTCALHAKVALVHFGHPEALASLIAEAKSKNGTDRYLAILALGRTGHADARDILLALPASEVVEEALASWKRARSRVTQ